MGYHIPCRTKSSRIHRVAVTHPPPPRRKSNQVDVPRDPTRDARQNAAAQRLLKAMLQPTTLDLDVSKALTEKLAEVEVSKETYVSFLKLCLESRNLREVGRFYGEMDRKRLGIWVTWQGQAFPQPFDVGSQGLGARGGDHGPGHCIVRDLGSAVMARAEWLAQQRSSTGWCPPSDFCVLLELQDQLRSLAARPETGGEVWDRHVQNFPWKSTAFHLSKVHERLYLDAYERQERQRALQETIQRAREFEVLDVFRSQHPWLNPARNAQESESYAWSICSANWSSIEGLEETTQVTQVVPEGPISDPSKLPKASRRSSRLVPSPRSPEPGDSLEAEGVSPAEYLPLVVCSLAGEEARQRRPSSSTPTLLGRSQSMGKPRRGGLPLGEATAGSRGAARVNGGASEAHERGFRTSASKGSGGLEVVGFQTRGGEDSDQGHGEAQICWVHAMLAVISRPHLLMPRSQLMVPQSAIDYGKVLN
eukprot:s2017_g7.t1